MATLSNEHFPTPIHRAASEAVTHFFAAQTHVHAVVLVNSCARGTAVPQSDLDFAILVEATLPNEAANAIMQAWQIEYATRPIYRKLQGLSRFSGIHLDLFNGQYMPTIWDEGGGPDSFEIEIGNQIGHGLPIWQRSALFAELRAQWLPYYPELLRQMRLKMVREACLFNLERLHFYVERQLYFQAFDRLYHAFQEFLQATFIAHRVYPIAYNKWLREQVLGWLQLPALYAELPAILQIGHLESDEILGNSQRLARMLDRWAKE